MTWTLFWDMHSGGGIKEGPYDKIYIEAPEGEARVVFFNRFGHNPERVSCTCCGEDYSLSEHGTLEEASQYHRESFGRGPTIPIEEYIAKPDVLVITVDEIKPEEREGDIPEQGYVWMGDAPDS